MLPKVQWAGDIHRRHAIWLAGRDEVLETTMVGEIVGRDGALPKIVAGADRWITQGPQPACSTAHAVLEIVVPLGEAIFEDTQHVLVELADQHVANGDVDLALVGLGATLVEAVGQVVQVNATRSTIVCPMMVMVWPSRTSKAAPVLAGTRVSAIDENTEYRTRNSEAAAAGRSGGNSQPQVRQNGRGRSCTVEGVKVQTWRAPGE